MSIVDSPALMRSAILRSFASVVSAAASTFSTFSAGTATTPSSSAKIQSPGCTTMLPHATGTCV
jgi:hypothetical protein